MVSYLITWNPRKWTWDTIDDDIRLCRTQGYYDGSWSCGITKRILEGDRLFLLRQGKEPRGIVGSGYATSGVYEDQHWDESRASLPSRYVDVCFDILLDAEKEPIFPRQSLDQNPYSDVQW
jgi:hypothetical protein